MRVSLGQRAVGCQEGLCAGSGVVARAVSIGRLGFGKVKWVGLWTFGFEKFKTKVKEKKLKIQIQIKIKIKVKIKHYH